ncbi:MAG: hypothetical protein PHQ27_04990 [Victivallales bacterium]|nr:hypothetical protein [Victivallales bacterium]
MKSYWVGMMLLLLGAAATSRSDNVIPGEMTFEGDFGAVPVRQVVYRPEDNALIIDHSLSYPLPLAAGAAAAVFHRVAEDGDFRYRSGMGGAAVLPADDSHYPLVVESMGYIGNILFGRLELLPHGCEVDPKFRPVGVPDGSGGNICLLLNFRYRLERNSRVLQCRRVKLEITLLPYSATAVREQGRFEYAEPSARERKIMMLYGRNVAGFRADFYLRRPLLVKLQAVGEVAVVAIWLKRHGIDPGALAAAIGSAGTGTKFRKKR